MGKYQVELTSDAIEDLQDAYDYYDSIKPNLGLEFFVEIQEELRKLENFPHYQKIFKDIRRLTNKRFKYNIYFYLEEHPNYKTVVIAFLHGSRDDRAWKDRL
ncbi:MAG: type II toxin-antitoxin system RelE/ParE family toxin [Bacteroidota bacterium]